MAIRTLEQIINSAISFFQSKRPNAATQVGTVLRDLVIESPAQEFSEVYTELEHTQKLSSTRYAEEMTEVELDALAENFGLTRLPGTQATGSITFRVRNYSTSSSNISIPVGTILSTVGSDDLAQVSFTTTQAVLFQNTLAPSYFNPATGFYEQTATIVAQDIGASSNVAASTITQLVSSIAGVDSVTNTTATTGGTDQESNAAFAERIQLRLSGNNVGTANGIISLLRDNSSVLDAIVVTPNDPEMLRAQFGGEVDAYVVGEILTSVSEQFLYTTSGEQVFILSNQPVRSVSSVTGLVSSAPYTFIEGTDYNYVPDPSILINGSTRTQSKIEFNIGGTNPDNNTNITVNYVYDSLISTLQAEIDSENNHILTSDILVKEATEVEVGVDVSIAIFSGNVAATVIADVQTALTNYINALGLNDSIDKSDIVGVIENVAAVDQVDLSSLVLYADGVPLPSTQQRLPISKTEYPRTGTLNITVVS